MPKPEKDTVQLHIELDRNQYERLRIALKALGYRTLAEFVREHIRRAISEGELVAQDESQKEV